MNTQSAYVALDADRDRRAAEEADVDRILGDRMLFEIRESQKYGGPSPPTIYRAERAGLIELVRNGDRTKLSRATMKRLTLQGLGPVTFTYGKRGKRSA